MCTSQSVSAPVTIYRGSDPVANGWSSVTPEYVASMYHLPDRHSSRPWGWSGMPRSRGSGSPGTFRTDEAEGSEEGHWTPTSPLRQNLFCNGLSFYRYLLDTDSAPGSVQTEGSKGRGRSLEGCTAGEMHLPTRVMCVSLGKQDSYPVSKYHSKGRRCPCRGGIGWNQTIKHQDSETT